MRSYPPSSPHDSPAPENSFIIRAKMYEVIQKTCEQRLSMRGRGARVRGGGEGRGAEEKKEREMKRNTAEAEGGGGGGGRSLH